MNMKNIELVVLIVYTILLLYISYYYRRKSNTQGQFFVAERSIGAVVNGAGIFAAVASAATYMGFISIGYVYGMPVSLCMLPAACAGYAFSLIGYSAPLQRVGRISMADVFYLRYGRVASVICSIMTIVFFFAYLIPQLKGGALILQSVLGVPYTAGIFIIGIVLILYVTVGGMYAVTWTEFIQGIILVASMVGLGFGIFVGMNGPEALFAAAINAAPNYGVVNPKFPMISIIGLFLSIFFFMGASPHVVQRQLTAKTPHAGRMSFVVAIAAYATIVPIGYISIISAGRVLFPNLKEPDFLILKMIEHFFSPTVSGIMISAIMAAIQSTVATMLLVISANVANDLYRSFKKDAKESDIVRLGKIACIILGILAMIVALKPPGLIGVLVGLITGAIGASFFFPLWLGLWWKRTNMYGGIAGMLGGLIIYTVLHLSNAMPIFAATIPAVIGSLILTVAVSLITSPPPKEAERLVEDIRDNVAIF